MASINVNSNAQDLADKLTAIAGNQMAFVMSKTLTGLANDVRTEETKGLERYFEVRTRWTKRSIKTIRAEKRDYPNSFSIVGVRDKILAKNITGGVRDDSGAVPGNKARSILNPGKKTLGPKYFPGRIVKNTRRRKSKNGSDAKPKPFKFKSTKGKTAGKEVIAIRRSKKRLPLDLLYVLGNDDINIRKTWPFVDNAKRIVNKNYAKKFRRNLSQALR